MIDEPLPSIKKASNDKKHRIFEVIQTIKDAILKRKFNQAWDHAAKYYEQNKASLSNQQVYQLCWLSCQSINKKVSLRLTSSPKSYIPLTQTHFQHLFSLFLSLKVLIFPEITSQDREHFDMLNVSENLINPKTVSQHDLIFQRKPSSHFIQKDQIGKYLKKLIKQYLRITNNVLMYRVKNKKSVENVIQSANNAEQIFASFKEHEFPVEMMNFQLIKLSIMEDLGIKQGFKCQYRLPIGLINKIYSQIRANKDQAVQHYVRKLTSYLVLSFRNLSISIQDIFIVSQQALYLTRLIRQKTLPSFYQTFQLKKKLPFLKLNRQMTLQGQPIQQNIMGRSNKSYLSGGLSTANKISEKKIESKTKLEKPEGKLRSIALLALQRINNHLVGRREVNQIISNYFTETQFQKFKRGLQQEIIDQEVLLSLSRKNRKGNSTEPNNEEIYEKLQRKQNKSISSILKKKGLQKKVSVFDESEKETLTTNVSNKNQGKFILKNIQSLKKVSQKSPVIQRKIERIISKDNFLDGIQLINQSSSDQEGNLKLTFERQRRNQIKLLSQKHSNKPNQKQNNANQNTNSQSIDQLQNLLETNLNESQQQRVRSISLLDDVVNSKVNDIFELPQHKIRTKSLSTMESQSTLDKLLNLKIQAESLNLERSLLVERLIKRSQTSELDQFDIPFNEEKIMGRINKNEDKIFNFAENLKEKVQKHISMNAKLMNLQKQNKFKITTQPKIKLKLDKGGKKLPELTFAKLEDDYKRLFGFPDDKKEEWDMTLSCQYDKLRRDVAKNQFASQNQRKGSNNKQYSRCQTIRQNTCEEDNV